MYWMLILVDEVFQEEGYEKPCHGRDQEGRAKPIVAAKKRTERKAK